MRQSNYAKPNAVKYSGSRAPFAIALSVFSSLVLAVENPSVMVRRPIGG
jgi:hypothetical protein